MNVIRQLLTKVIGINANFSFMQYVIIYLNNDSTSIQIQPEDIAMFEGP